MTNRARKNVCRHALTLMEMVIALAIMTVVFAAVLPQFRLIHNSWDTRQASAETVQNGRVFVDFLNRTLAAAVKINTVSSSTDTDGYIEFEAADGTVYRCDLAEDNYIEFGETGDQSELAGPVSSLKFVCYNLDDFDTPTTIVDEIRLVTAEAVFPDSSDIGSDKTFSASAFIQANGNPEEVQNSSASMPGIVVKDQIDYGGSLARFDSYYSSKGSYASQTAGDEVVITTNSTASSRFTLYNAAIIYGDAYIGKNGNVNRTICLWGGSKITGTKDALEENITITYNTFPSYSIFTNYAQNWHGYYGYGHGYGYGGGGYVNYTLSLWGSQKETVTENTYYDGVYLYGNSKLIVDGDVVIGINGNLEIDSTSCLELTEGSTLDLYISGYVSAGGTFNDGGIPNDLRIYMTGTSDFTLYQNAVVYAVLSHPKGDVELWNNCSFYGLVMAEDLFGSCPIHVDMDARFDGDTSISGSSAVSVSP